jgi:hypothetical protein
MTCAVCRQDNAAVAPRPSDGLPLCGRASCLWAADRDEWPVHQPRAWDAPIPGTHWYSGCDPDRPRVRPDGTCESCGERACPECGREKCPDHKED